MHQSIPTPWKGLPGMDFFGLSPNASIDSKREHAPGQTPRGFFEVVKGSATGQNFSAKARPPGQKTPTPGSILEDLVSFSC